MARLLRLLALLLLLVGVPAVAQADDPEEAAQPGKPDPELQKAIDQAIEKGADWLRDEQKASGAFLAITKDGKGHHSLGVAALVGLALLAAGDQRGDEVVDLIYRYAQARDKKFVGGSGRATYDAGILLMFITAYWRGPVQEEHTGHSRPGRRHRNPCDLPPEAMEWVKDLADWLRRRSQAKTMTWGYPDHRDDHSNTQYAFLGLRAARDCGIKMPHAVFITAARTLMERQEKDGPKVPRIIPSPDPDASPYVIDCGDRARGWSYLQAPFLPTGSMTTSGIAILAICHYALTRPKRAPLYDGKMERRVTQSIQDGFSWLDKNWSVTKNPPGGVDNWHYYYLYGLERAAIFGGRALVGQHDWYIEGARYLVSKQGADGRWSTGFLENQREVSDLIDTAWAILFLAKATRPMPPIEAPVVTPGD